VGLLEAGSDAYNIDMSQPRPNTHVVHTVCTHDCPDSCGVLVTVDSLTGRAVKVQGDSAHPVTRGFLCGKVARYLDRVYAPDRLLYPMRRKPGVPKGPIPQGREAEAFERISWDTAIDLVAEKLTSIASEHGPESILPYSYAGTIGQLGYGSMDRRLFHRLGASQLDRTICSSAGGEALTRVYGTRVGPTPQEFAFAKLILVWGGNVHGNNIHLWPFIEQARRNGARLIVIDPYRTRTAALADEHLQINPGTDTLLALAMMHVLFRDGLADEAYLRDCADGWEQLRDHALKADHTPERAAAITGIAADNIEQLARAYGLQSRSTEASAIIRVNYGIQRSEGGGTAVRAVSMLPLVTGSWKQRGGGVLLSMSKVFPFASEKLQMPELMRQSSLGRDARVVNMNELGLALTELSPTHAPSETMPAGPMVKALVVYNCNAAAVAPDSERVLAGLRRDDLFTVVHEQFFTDTVDYADIILPATTFLEHEELMGSYGHRVAQRSFRAIEPLGEARSNIGFFGALGQRMFPGEAIFEATEKELIAQALMPRGQTLATIDVEALERDGQFELVLPKNEQGITLPFSTPEWFAHTRSGKAELLPVPEFLAPVESRSSTSEEARAFPLEFLPRKADNYMNTTFANHPVHQQMERRSEGVLEMHETDATPRGIATGDRVSIFNARGRIALTARIGNSVGAGVVAARLDWQKLAGDGKNVNTLTSQRLTDIGGGATFYSTLVEVEKIAPEANPEDETMAAD